MTTVTAVLAPGGVPTTERRECRHQCIDDSWDEEWTPACTGVDEERHDSQPDIQVRTVLSPPDCVYIPLGAVTCQVCDGAPPESCPLCGDTMSQAQCDAAHAPDARWIHGRGCGACGGRGSVLPSLPDGTIHVAEPCRQCRGLGFWDCDHGDRVAHHGCQGCGGQGNRFGSGTLSQWVADRDELWPVIAAVDEQGHSTDDWPADKATHVRWYHTAGAMVWRYDAGTWGGWDIVADVTYEPWAASLKPGDAVAALYDLRRIEPPITEMVPGDCDGSTCWTRDLTGVPCRVPLSVAPGVVNRIEVP